MANSPIPLDYRTPPPRPPMNRQGFFKWLAIGAGASIICWSVAVAARNEALAMLTLAGLPFCQLIIGVLMIIANRKYAGLGLIVSIPLGLLIGLGICAATTH